MFVLNLIIYMTDMYSVMCMAPSIKSIRDGGGYAIGDSGPT
jgi:hypothetical protein